MFSASCQYAIRAMTLLAQRPGDADEYHSIRKIADELDISFAFLTKILQQLTKAGLLASYRGPRGGVALTRPPRDIRLVEIIEGVEGSDWLRTCALGLPTCSDRHPCPLHTRWARERKRLRDLFTRTTLQDLARRPRS